MVENKISIELDAVDIGVERELKRLNAIALNITRQQERESIVSARRIAVQNEAMLQRELKSQFTMGSNITRERNKVAAQNARAIGTLPKVEYFSGTTARAMAGAAPPPEEEGAETSEKKAKSGIGGVLRTFAMSPILRVLAQYGAISAGILSAALAIQEILKIGMVSLFKVLGSILKVIGMIVKPIFDILAIALMPLLYLLMPFVKTMNLIFAPLRERIMRRIQEKVGAGEEGRLTWPDFLSIISEAIGGILTSPFGLMPGGQFMGMDINQLNEALGAFVLIGGAAYIAAGLINSLAGMVGGLAGAAATAAGVGGLGGLLSVLAAILIPAVAFVATLRLWQMFLELFEPKERSLVSSTESVVG